MRTTTEVLETVVKTLNELLEDNEGDEDLLHLIQEINRHRPARELLKMAVETMIEFYEYTYADEDLLEVIQETNLYLNEVKRPIMTEPKDPLELGKALAKLLADLEADPDEAKAIVADYYEERNRPAKSVEDQEPKFSGPEL